MHHKKWLMYKEGPQSLHLKTLREKLSLPHTLFNQRPKHTEKPEERRVLQEGRHGRLISNSFSLYRFPTWDYSIFSCASTRSNQIILWSVYFNSTLCGSFITFPKHSQWDSSLRKAINTTILRLNYNWRVSQELT